MPHISSILKQTANHITKIQKRLFHFPSVAPRTFRYTIYLDVVTISSIGSVIFWLKYSYRYTHLHSDQYVEQNKLTKFIQLLSNINANSAYLLSRLWCLSFFNHMTNWPEKKKKNWFYYIHQKHCRVNEEND